MNNYADFSNPAYLQGVYNSLKSAGAILGSGWDAFMQPPTQQPQQGGGLQAGAPQQSGFGSGSSGEFYDTPFAQNMPGTFGTYPPPQNMPQQSGFPQPSYQTLPGAPMQGQPYGQPQQTQFDGNPWQQQVGPNRFVGGYGGGPQPQQNYTPPPAQSFGAPSGYTSERMPSTYAVSQPVGGPINNSSPYGLPQGPLQGNILQVLQALGFPELGTASAMMGGGALSRTNVPDAVQGLGGGSMLSPQSLQGMSPSGQDYFAGLIETILGMPMADYLQGAYQPFQGLGKGKKSRTRSATRTN
jgi:hypothetical protein